MSCYCRCGGHGRAHQVGAASWPLPAFKVAIGGRSATFTRFKTVIVHRKAHRTSRLAPFKSCVAEYPVQPLLLRLVLDQARTRHDHRKLDVFCNMPAFYDFRRSPQILYAGIRAGTDEYLVRTNFTDWSVRCKRHIL